MDRPGLEIQTDDLRAAMWALGIELGSSARTASALNHRAMFRAPNFYFFIHCPVLVVLGILLK